MPPHIVYVCILKERVVSFLRLRSQSRVRRIMSFGTGYTCGNVAVSGRIHHSGTPAEQQIMGKQAQSADSSSHQKAPYCKPR